MAKNKRVYLDIAETLRTEIVSQRLQAHARLASEPELVRRFSVARATIRRALAKLQQDGVIYSRQAVGSFVAEPRINQDLAALFSFSELMATHGIRPGSVVLEAGVQQILSKESPILEQLQLPAGSKVITLKRLRLGNAEPLVIANTWLPEKWFRGFLERDIKHTSVYDIMASLGHRPTRAEQSIEAVTLGTEEAKLLAVPSGAPALLIRRLAFCGATPVEYAVDYYRGDRTKFRVQLGAGESSRLSRL